MKDGGDVSNVVFESGLEPVLISDTSNDEFFYNVLGAAVPPTVSADDFPWVDTDLSLDDNILQGSVTGTRTLDANVSYNLTSALIVQNGAKLVIPSGTKITARAGGTGVYIAVLKGGQIEIDGTADNPSYFFF